MVMSSQKREEEEKRKETEKKEKRKCSKNLYNAYMLFLLYACMCVCVCVCVWHSKWQSQILRQHWATSAVLSPIPGWFVQCCCIHILCICVSIHMCTHAHVTHQKETVLMCAHTIYVCVRAAARNISIITSASWWLADVSLSFPVGAGAPGSRPIPWGALSWDWTHRPLGVTVALLSIVERGLLRWGNWISKESCFSAQVEGCLFVWDVLHFETHTSPPLPL